MATASTCPCCAIGQWFTAYPHQGSQPGLTSTGTPRMPSICAMSSLRSVHRARPPSRNQQGHGLAWKAETHIFFIAFASVAASCSSERAQKEAAERKEMGRQLTAAYYSCVRTSFASQLPTMVDRNMAIDQAFMVCRTEESNLRAFEDTLSESTHTR